MKPPVYKTIKLWKVIQRAAVPLLLGLCATTAGFAASPYAGVYMGGYISTNEQGRLAVFIDNSAWGALLASSDNDQEGGGFFSGFTVNSNGAFSFTPDDTTISGTILGTHLTGTYSGTNSAGTFSATRKSTTGIKQAAVGIYSGIASSPDPRNPDGLLNFILAADGTLLGLHQDLGGERNKDGISGSIDDQNHVSFDSVSGVTATGVLNSTTFKITGFWTSTNGSGSFNLTRVHNLQGAVCNYSLSAYSAVFNADGGSGSFTVSCGANCPWGSVVNHGWLHATDSDFGPGTVTYIVGTNYDLGFRTGTITVGDQVFTITQAPQGYIWHRIFGWLYDAGGGWRWSSGFGWMWFSDGPWVYSTSLQGWLADMGGTSRTMWSPQFRWLTPSDSNPYRAETTSLGTIYVGQYAGISIPDGFAATDRFGYIWPAGDGVWFYSSTYQWLGVTADGGIWCVSQNRWL